ncbi:hypothetical protein F5Y16DRAFT_384925 [Xylariaceae sp. FL0255]|nr:hypothetical protein F5Y16DRAFT_384925 [Xylariaceae sp. FL0255]
MSSANIDAPGAYPTTPSADEAMSMQRQPEAPRSLGDESMNTNKPGVMTGAYSRVGNQGKDFTDNGNYTYGSNPTSMNETNPVERQNVHPTTLTTDGTATSTSALGSTNNESASHDVTNPEEGEGHNIVRSGLREKSDIHHENAYWGDIPHGQGIYNTVTGHGSAESPGHQRAQTDEMAAGISPNNQRSFPLSGNTADHETTGNLDNSGRDSHFREGLAGAGAAGAGAYAAHELSDKRQPGQQSQLSQEQDMTNTNDRRSQPFAPAQNKSAVNEPLSNEQSTMPTKRSTPFQPAPSNAEYYKQGIADNENAGAKSRRDKEGEMALAGATAAYAAHEHSDRKDEKAAAKDEEPKKESKIHSLLDKAKGHNKDDESKVDDKPVREEKKESKPHALLEKHEEKKAEKKEAKAEEEPKHKKKEPAVIAAVDKPHRHEEKDAKAAEEEQKPKEKKESKLASLFHLGHKDKDEDARKNEKPSDEEVAAKVDALKAKAASDAEFASGTRHSHEHHDRKHEEEAAAATGVGAAAAYGAHKHQNEAANPQQSFRKEESTIAQPSKPTEQDPNRRKYEEAAAATTGAGVGAAYGAHKYAEHDNTEKSREPASSAMPETNTAPFAASRLAPMESVRNEPEVAGNSRNEMHDRNVPITTTAGRGSSDSSHGGQYAVLSSGTPSGINIGEEPTSASGVSAPSTFQEKRQAERPSGFVSNASPAAAKNTNTTEVPTAAAATNPSQEEPYQAKDAENNGLAISDLEQAAQSTSQKKADETAAKNPEELGAMRAQDGYAPTGENKSVIHHCVKCGAENDISSYLKP